MCSTIERRMIAFPIERKARDLSEVDGTFVVALFDCCRGNMTVNEVQKGKKIKVDGRGGGTAFDEEDYSVAKARDLMIVFGCPPNSYTPAESTLTGGFFQTLSDMSDRVEKVVDLPGNSTAWKPCNKGEVLNFTHHDCVLPFSAEKNPLCFKKTTLTKINSKIRHVAEMSISALRQKVFVKEEKIFYNELEGSIVAISPISKRMKMLQPYGTFEPYRSFNTCQIDRGLFQLSNDTCQILLPNFRTRRFTIEERSPIPFQASWFRAATVGLPGKKVLVIGPRWDIYNLTPWVHDLKGSTWSNKLTPDGKTLPSLPNELLVGSAIYLENKVYLFKEERVWILDLTTLAEWKELLPNLRHGNIPVVVPFSPTQVALIGGYGNGPLNYVTVFNTELRQAKPLASQMNELSVASALQ